MTAVSMSQVGLSLTCGHFGRCKPVQSCITPGVSSINVYECAKTAKNEEKEAKYCCFCKSSLPAPKPPLPQLGCSDGMKLCVFLLCWRAIVTGFWHVFMFFCFVCVFFLRFAFWMYFINVIRPGGDSGTGHRHCRCVQDWTPVMPQHGLKICVTRVLFVSGMQCLWGDLGQYPSVPLTKLAVGLPLPLLVSVTSLHPSWRWGL